MKKLFIILLVVLSSCATPKECCGQTVDTSTYTFTEKEVVGMDSLFQVYEQTDSLQKLEINLLNIQIRNYTKLHIQDSLHVAFMNEKTELRQKWYNKPVIHFFLGAATIVTSSWVVSNIK